MFDASKPRKRKALGRYSPKFDTDGELWTKPLDQTGFQKADELYEAEVLGEFPAGDELSSNASESETAFGFESMSSEEDIDDAFEAIESDEIPADGKHNLFRRKATSSADEESAANKNSVLFDFYSLGNEDSLDGNQDGAHYMVTKDANGNQRFIYKDIDPVYDSDDSDAPQTTNTIGNIPLSFYDSYPHIGYDINGKKVMRPAKGAALDTLLDSIEIPQGWTGLVDPGTGKPLELSDEELQMLKRLTKNEIPGGEYDPYPEAMEIFTNKTEVMPLSSAPEPKRRFVPSKHEAKRIIKIVRAIKEGRIQPYRTMQEEEQSDIDAKRFDIWADETPRPDHRMNMPAPKLPPPGYDESYHPPPEYLPDEDEEKAWNEADEEDRKLDYLPSNHDALRKVPGYERFVKEKFERCLDLYLAPRVRRSKLNINPETLLPKLPDPEELRPFPNRCDICFVGHKGRVRSLAISPLGNYLATSGDDGTVRVWTVLDGRQVWSAKLADSEAVDVVRWRPNNDSLVLSAATNECIYLIAPALPSLGAGSHSSDDTERKLSNHELLSLGWEHERARSTSDADNTQDSPAKWSRPGPQFQEQGILVKITLRSSVKKIAWHRKGEYFSSVAPRGQSNAIAIHTLSKHLTQLPFRRLKGLAQAVEFHPSKPIFFVATQRTIRIYDLLKQELVKILQPGARWISSFDVHPGGDNLIVGSYDRRLLWFDLDLSNRPYKTLRYHHRAIRSTRYHHGGLPLFADASDDGTVQIFHGKVVGDLMENANIVPLKVLKGHKLEKGLGVLEIDWHPTNPWLVSAGADGTCRLWMD